MTQFRSIKKIYKSSPVVEGAGVHLKRVFGFFEVPELDPFLMLDDFHSDQPSKYEKGFPWHPHRGIETISYILQGEVEHGDSMGNKGLIQSGDVQWMTAGNGIVHQEMPKGDDQNRLWGFQLWANLPASHKMMDPRYQEIKAAEVPEITLDNGVTVKIICGEVNGKKGPVTDIVIDPQYLDVTVPANEVFTHSVTENHCVFAYVIEGAGLFEKDTLTPTGVNHLVLYEANGSVRVETKDSPVRFLLVAGCPIKEPVAWKGPIVMNTDEELETAFNEYQNGTFLKHQKESG